MYEFSYNQRQGSQSGPKISPLLDPFQCHLVGMARGVLVGCFGVFRWQLVDLGWVAVVFLGALWLWVIGFLVVVC